MGRSLFYGLEVSVIAGNGPPPKVNSVRRNPVDTSHLQAEHEVNPKLKKLFKKDSYCTFTIMWWETWANSEQAEYFSATDWMRLQQTALLVEKYYQGQSHFVMAEIRQNESLLGGTITDRMRLKVHALNQHKNNKEIENPSTVEADLELYAELNDD